MVSEGHGQAVSELSGWCRRDSYFGMLVMGYAGIYLCASHQVPYRVIVIQIACKLSGAPGSTPAHSRGGVYISAARVDNFERFLAEVRFELQKAVRCYHEAYTQQISELRVLLGWSKHWTKGGCEFDVRWPDYRKERVARGRRLLWGIDIDGVTSAQIMPKNPQSTLCNFQ